MILCPLAGMLSHAYVVLNGMKLFLEMESRTSAAFVDEDFKCDLGF